MSEWKPIETAPRDGTVILLTDGALFAAGALHFNIEPETIADLDRFRRERAEYERDQHIPDMSFSTKLCQEAFTIPRPGAPPGPAMHSMANPKAGHRNERWSLNGCSAFHAESPTDDDGRPAWFEPTHWMPLPELPAVVPSGSER